MDQVTAAPVTGGAHISLWHLLFQASWPVFIVMMRPGPRLRLVLGHHLREILCRAPHERRQQPVRDQFWSGQSLEDLYRSHGRAAMPSAWRAIFISAMEEWKRSQGAAMRAGFAGVLKRIEKVMDVSIQKEMGRLEARLLFLATVGSAGPFIGLFGTVWGIMTSFQGIANSQNTNLAVVAPGIAEALFATAIGLVAAIPATIFYNMYSSDAAKIGTRLENFADEFSAIISRQLDERA